MGKTAVKLNLNKQGKERILNIKVLLDWLALGGDLPLPSGHSLAMTEDGLIGFKATHWKDGVENEIIFQCDSDVALQMFNDWAKNLTEEGRAAYAMNLALNRG